jgi:hypothetical protein
MNVIRMTGKYQDRVMYCRFEGTNHCGGNYNPPDGEFPKRLLLADLEKKRPGFGID